MLIKQKCQKNTFKTSSICPNLTQVHFGCHHKFSSVSVILFFIDRMGKEVRLMDVMVAWNVQKWETHRCLWVCVRQCKRGGDERENSQRAHCVHINGALRKSHQPGRDRGQLRLPGPWLNRLPTISPVTSPRVRIASSIYRVLAIKPTLSHLWSVRVGGGPEYMNFDQGAQNARGCGDVTRQRFLLLLCSFSPHPPAVWVGITEEKALGGILTEPGFKPPITDQPPSARLRKTASLTGYFWPIWSRRARSSAETISANIHVLKRCWQAMDLL